MRLQQNIIGFTVFQFGNLDLTKPPPLDKTGLLLNLFYNNVNSGTQQVTLKTLT